MIKETDSIYAYKVEHTKDFSFKTMMKLANDFVNNLDKEQINELFEQLKRGVDLLSTEPQMNMYLYAYGKMHEAKLKMAFENMGEDYKQMDDFAIVDYGCGQGLASIVLYDHLKALGLEKNVHKVVLIEPSEAALKRAALHVSKAFPKAEIVTLDKYLDDLTKEDIKCENMMVFHLFSNIIDVECISLKHLSNIVNTTKSKHKKIICVSPNFGGLERNRRIDIFCSKIEGEESYSCDKLKGEWIKEWSCRIRVKSVKDNSNTEVVEEAFLSTKATDEELAEAWEDEFGVKYSKDRKKVLKGNEDLSDYSIKPGTRVICDRAFEFCRFLQSIHIPNSVTSIGTSAFFVCSSLRSINIPGSVTSIGKDTFYMCISLRSINIPNSVKSIGYSAFYGCNLIIYINSLQFYSDGYCLIDVSKHRLLCHHRTDLKHYSIPASVTIIGKEAFLECDSLLSITIPDSVTSIGEESFFGCSSLQNITIPHSVTNVGKEAFFGCSSLQNITIPHSVTNIGKEAFFGCSSLQNINIPDSVTSIGDSAFVKCKSLRSITIPGSVISIGDGVFSCCNLQIYIDSTKYYSDGCCLLDLSSHRLLCYHRINIENYSIPDTVKIIGNGAFQWCRFLQNIIIPDSVISIGDEAFVWCELLQSINIPDSVISIGDSTFMGCKSLQSINIPNNVTNIGDNAFAWCELLQSINIPDSVTSIGDSAFMGCKSLQRINIPESVKTIINGAFFSCESLQSITIPRGTREKFEKLLPEYKDIIVEQK